MGGKDKEGGGPWSDMARIASIAVACSTITALIISATSSYGGDKEKIYNNEGRSKKNEDAVTQILIQNASTKTQLDALDRRLGNIEEQLKKLVEQKEKKSGGG